MSKNISLSKFLEEMKRNSSRWIKTKEYIALSGRNFTLRIFNPPRDAWGYNMVGFQP
jgi:hypothetical protein